MGRTRLPTEPRHTTIESLADDGRGVARIEDKITFIEGALPGESVLFTYKKRRRSYDEGEIKEVLERSPDRVSAGCEFFDICGGCSLQHLAADKQVEIKQQWLLDKLQHAAGMAPKSLLEPITGSRWGYRRKARLGVKDVPKKGGVLVGFREKRSPYIAQISRCEVLHPSVGERLTELSTLIEGLSVRRRVPQIEVAVGDNATALVFRHLDPLTEQDRELLTNFGEQSGIHMYLQPGGPDTVHALWPRDSALYYRLPGFEVEIGFGPVEFAQVNAEINERMVAQAVELLAPKSDEYVLDLFCGIGNFSLPLARKSKWVTGVEVDEGLVGRARDNARRNGIENAEFVCGDLSAQTIGTSQWLGGGIDKVLLDPARPGAEAAVRALGKSRPRRIVYVSCHPATLARDAGILVREHGYELSAAGVMDMFPHTAHIEAMALFSV